MILIFWVYREQCFKQPSFFNPIINECDFGFIVNCVLNYTDSLTQLKIKTKWSFNKSLIRLKFERDNINYQIWEMIENGVSLVLLLAIVKSLIRFEREMVIKFTDNTMVLDMEYYQFSPWDE